MKLLGSTEQKTTKDKIGENLPQIEITEVVRAHCDIINNQYQHDSRGLSTFVPSKSFDELLNISPTNHIYSETFHSVFSDISYIIDQNSVPLEIEDRINLTLVVNNKSI